MKEEKMMILAMLEEGKITSEEAIKLLEALEDIDMPNKHSHKEENNHNNYQDKVFSKPIFNTLENIGSDIGNALSNMFDGLKDVGSSFGFRNNYETISKDIVLDLDFDNPSLDLRAVNGSIRLKPISGNQLKVNATCQYKNGLFSQDESFFDFSASGNIVTFSPKYINNISIKLDVFYPEKQYDEIILNSTNGKIQVEELKVNNLYCTTTNSSIDLEKVNAKNIELTTKNGKINCQYTNANNLNANTTNSSILVKYNKGQNINLRTANSKIDVGYTDAEKIICKTSNATIVAESVNCDIIHLVTSNGKIICDDIDMSRVKEMKLVTSNGSISSEVHTPNRDVYFDLETSMGNINLEIPNLIYKVNKQINLGIKKIVAHSTNFDENKDHLKFIASTSNGSIKIS